MANVKISNLTAATTPVAGTEVLPIVQSGATVKVSIANLTPGLDTITAAKGGTGQTSYAVGDLLYASTTTALSKLADVATGNALISGGVSTAPSYGKIGLTTHVSGTLPTANGGTNLTSFTSGGVVYASSSSALTTGSTLVFDGTNFGVGVTPPTSTSGSYIWNRGGCSLSDGLGQAYYVGVQNAVYNSAWKYVANGFAGSYLIGNGQHVWNYAASGTAGGTISFTQAMMLDGGNLLVGTTSANGRLSIDSAGTTSATYIIFGRNSAASNKFTVRSDGAGFLDSAAWTYGSDATIKENIEYLEPSNCLSLLLNAKPAKFDYIEGQKANYGYIAQDVQKWLPEAVSETPNGKLGLQDGFINAIGTGAIQALHQLIQEQQALITQLQADVAALKGT